MKAIMKGHMRKTSRWLSFLVLGAILIGSLAGCSSSPAAPAHALAMAPMADMPMDVQRAPLVTQEAYQFAFANQDVMTHIPCYCGCKDIHHKNNFDCYVSGQSANGQTLYDPHALKCQVCVDITHDVMRMTGEGKSPGAIKTYIDRQYSRFGPSNMN
jgi:hypothetical protein